MNMESGFKLDLKMNSESGHLIKFLFLKGTVMKIEKALINNRLCISKASWKFRIPIIHNFAVIYS